MKKSTIALSVLCFVLALAFLAPRARADEWNKETILTFNQPVEIPGKVLPAGTYVFRLLDSQSDRNIVQILNKREDKVYATVLAIPDFRLKPADKTVITFGESPAGAPETVKAWFYPGDEYGQEFVYPRNWATALASAARQPAPPAPKVVAKPANAPEAAALTKAPVVAMAEPQTAPEQPVETAQARPLAPPPTIPSQPMPAHPARLPRTASDLPLTAVAGLFSLAIAGILRAAAQRV